MNRKIQFAVCLLFLLTLMLPAGPVADVANTAKDASSVRNAKGELQVFVLSNEYIVIAGLYGPFIASQTHADYHTRLSLADSLEKRRLLPRWSYAFFYNHAVSNVYADFLPQMRKNFQAMDYFKLQSGTRPLKIAANGYWINAVGTQRVPRISDKNVTEMTNSGELVPFAYLKLASPLRNGESVSVVSANGEETSFVYNDLTTISRAIKVNQVGYASEAGSKYAYVGMFMGSLGSFPVKPLVGKDFFIRNASSHAVVFTGKVAFRSMEQYISRNGAQIPLNGEEVAELNFSSFKTPGEYYIQLPGVGRSWPFVVGDDAVGRAFYVQTRGLFHQRSGIAKTAAHTRWTMGADHMQSYRGGFIPNDRHYKGTGSLIRDRQGRTVDVRHFDMVRATATDEVLDGVYGGWWDAGDFDRRTYHFEVVDALLSAYLLFPENFSDNQLDIPESGNGIPDIIDEAAWGVDVWRKAQNEKGGVGCWLEATSHPENPDPVKDVQRYYLALPTRESTIVYCAHAAKLARAYRKAGDQKKADLFFRSALKAWEYAMNPANRQKTEFTLPKKKEKLSYAEPEQLVPEDVYKALVNLYLYTRSGKYADMMSKFDFPKLAVTVRNTRKPYYLCELLEEQIPFYTHIAEYEKMVLTRADYLLAAQESLAYRNVNWDLKSGFFTYLAWGEALPPQKGTYFILAWRITRKAKYRDAAFLGFDWMMGANPMGRSMTTGLGQVYPVRLLSLPMWAWRDRLVDPIPGITPYTFTGMNDYSAANRIFLYDFPARRDHAFAGCNVNMLPYSWSRSDQLSRKECYSILHRNVPIWRRFANVEGYAVPQNEFSVWETMAPAAAFYGALLRPDWKPKSEWKSRKPEPDIRKLNGYIFLP